MGHSYVCSYFHCIWSTKERKPLISSELEQRLWPYMGGIARDNGFKALAIGGTADHVHLLLSLPGRLAIAKAVQLIKGGSSKWVHDDFPQHQAFEWQEGYGAFSIGVSHREQTVAYIQNQKQHHRRKTYQDEFLSFLKKHDVEYDPRFIWG
jgi:REP element-mobilizing transposase RayT